MQTLEVRRVPSSADLMRAGDYCLIEKREPIRVASWVRSHTSQQLASCPITELGFLRVLAQAPAYGFTVAQGRTLLLRLKRGRRSRLTFIPDEHDVSHLPGWVRAPKQITDGHLGQLASANGAVLATLDESIPDSYLIPR